MDSPSGNHYKAPAAVLKLIMQNKEMVVGKMAATLEGGYNPGVLARNVVTMVKIWSGIGREAISIEGEPKKETLRVLGEVRKVHGETWPCFK